MTSPEAFKSWVEAALQAAGMLNATDLQLQPLSGDAGFRSYYRIADCTLPILAVSAPPDTEKNEAFCHIAQLLRQNGVHAPQVYAVDFEQGFLLIEDLGDALYQPLLEAGQQETLYADAITCLRKLQHIATDHCGLPLYDREQLQLEMNLFPQWFVEQLLNIDLTESEQMLLEDVYVLLIDSAMQQPQVIVHRDFHCRNLLRLENNNPGVIDFQDGVVGPLTYDLVSLYRDCYICWPPQQVEAWVLQYYHQLREDGVLNEQIDEVVFLQWFDWMGLQRHIKVLGIFSRLCLRDSKSQYLNDLPLVIHYTLSVARQYPELMSFVDWFEMRLLPVIESCEWYRNSDYATESLT